MTVSCPAADMCPGFALVAVEPADAACFERAAQPRVELVGKFGEPGRALGRDDLAYDPGAMIALQVLDQRLGRTRRRSQAVARIALRFVAEKIQRTFEVCPHAASPTFPMSEACGRQRLTA